MKILWTSEALARLKEIKRYIVKNSPNRATQFIQSIIDRTEVLVDNPLSGRMVPEISRSEIREIIFHNYRIVYRIKTDCIEILTVFEGHMLLQIDKLSV